MGTFRVNLWVGSLFTDAGATVEALVDTGATHSMVPGSLLQQPGIEQVETRTSRIADGSRMEMQTAWARFSAEGRNAVARVSFGPEGTYLMGATTLEDMGLAVDSVDQRPNRTGRPAEVMRRPHRSNGVVELSYKALPYVFSVLLAGYQAERRRRYPPFTPAMSRRRKRAMAAAAARTTDI